LVVLVASLSVAGGFLPRSACLHQIHDMGWYPCVDQACVEGRWESWPTYVEVETQCSQFCQRSSFGIACEFGDIFVRARSGFQVNLHCQCNGRSNDRFCVSLQKPILDLFETPVQANLPEGRNRCKNWCMDPFANTKNTHHCPQSGISFKGRIVPTIPTSSPTRAPTNRRTRRPKRRAKTVTPPGPLQGAPLANLTCKCLGTGTAEDDGVEIEEPVLDRRGG